MRGRAHLLVALVALVSARAAFAGIVDDLYGHRLLFTETGAPLVPIGMMQGQKRVVVESDGPLVVLVDEDKLEWPAKTPLTIERKSGTAAKVSAFLVVETLEAEARLKKRDALKVWTERGFAAVLKDVGGVYGVKGTVVDNRAALVLVPDAPGVAPKLEAFGARPAPLEWMDASPAAVLSVGDKRGSAVRVSVAGTATITVRDVEHSVGYAEHGFANRTLRGDVLVLPDKSGQLAVVSLVDEDALVGGVLPSEMFASAPLEALKAQAVTARGELFSKIGRRHFADPFLVCSEQHCQVYKGVTAEDPRTNKAAEATRGELAFVNGRLVESVYSACCGGHTEAADVVWDRPPQSALVGTPDASALFGPLTHDAGPPGPATVPPATVPLEVKTDSDVRALLALPREATWCGRSTFNQKGDAYRWIKRFTVAELTTAFADLGVGDVTGVRIDERGPGGRLRALIVTGTKGEGRVLRELPVRKKLGNLKSGVFVVEEDRDASGALMGVTLRGAGFGHGSGMCQQGAIGMAEAGKTYTEILGHYYAGAEVKRVF